MTGDTYERDGFRMTAEFPRGQRAGRCSTGGPSPICTPSFIRQDALPTAAV